MPIIISMRKEELKNKLSNFIEKSTCSFTSIKNIKSILKKEGFKELKETEEWNLSNDKFFVVRNDASIIAFEIPENELNSFSIITTHSDVPALLLKPIGIYTKNNYLQYNIMPYGGILNYGFLDRPFSLAGRVVIKEDNKLKIKIVDLKEPLMIVPSVAIHLKDDANTNLDLNAQNDMQPILSLKDNIKYWDKILKKYIKEEIVDYELFTYSLEKPILMDDSLFISPRIDNLTSVFNGLYSFLETKSNNIKLFCAFNNEEIGSLTVEGADSNFLIDILKRVSASLNIDIASTLANSFIISSDNTHAIHPNHSEYSDKTGSISLGEGFAIIKESESTTNSISLSIAKTICDKNKIKYKVVTTKNDLTTGSALSGISLRHVSVLSIDVGISELAMHSSIETCSINDIYELYKFMCEFYKTTIIKENNSITIKTS